MVSYTRISLGLAVALVMVAVPTLKAQNSPESKRPGHGPATSFRWPKEDFRHFLSRTQQRTAGKFRKTADELLNNDYDLKITYPTECQNKAAGNRSAGCARPLPAGVSWDQLSR